MDDRRPFIAAYIMVSRPFGTLYIGSTSTQRTRSGQHRRGAFDGFTSKYGCSVLVWFENHVLMTEAIRRERALKRWNRPWKLDLVTRTNPEWTDLFPFILGDAPDPRVKPEGDEGSVEAFLARLDRGAAE